MTNTITILLACLSMIESGDDDRKIGDHGKSRGRYQISEKAWMEETCMDFSRAHREGLSRIIAEKLLTRRTRGFALLLNREPTPLEIYVLWNAPAQAMRGKISRRVMERAKRFENLVRDAVRKQKGVK